MSKRQFTPFSPRVKPAKPYEDFPLFPHANGTWAKKIRSKLHYFGPWDDADGALKKYLAEKDDLHAGRRPKQDVEALTVKELANHFLDVKQELVNTGELSARMWADYKEATDETVAAFGRCRLVSDLGPDDFEGLRAKMARRWGLVRLGNVIGRIRSIFKYALDAALIDRPVRFGPGFQRPSKKTLRIHRAKQGPKLLSREQIVALLAGAEGSDQVQADPEFKAMVLLGINCGLGNSDVATLPLSTLDLDRGWLDFPRPKTGVARRCHLWPETVAALQAVLDRRRTAKNDADAEVVFITARGGNWTKETGGNYLSWKFGKLLKRAGCDGRKGLGFYTLRHTFRTVADEAKDPVAADHIMGHEVANMSSVYRETISDERLKAVADHVRNWLFGKK